MKKLFALLLCLAMVVSMFAACGGDKKTDNNATEATKTAESKDPSEVTLTIGLPKSAMVTDYYENHYTKWLEEKTGYKLEFQFFAAAAQDYKSQLSTMVSSKMDLPDILYGFGLGTDLYERYGKDGVFVDLAPYFNDKEGKSAEWWARFGQLTEESQANIWRRMQSADGEGHIYAFPEIQTSMIDIMDYQVWINKTWLDNLGLDMPHDPESMYQVLKAFKENDCNGNGQMDEIPLIGTAGSLSGQTLHWLINMFIYEDDAIWFNVDDNGKLYSPYREDAYRKALQYIRKLYDEKLMSPLTLTASHTDIKQMVTPSEGASQLAGIVCGHLTLCFVQDHEGIMDYELLPLWGNALFHEDINNYTTFVTRTCQERGNMDAAWNLLMVMSSYESSIIQRYGKEGTPEEGGSWTWAPEGTESIMGIDAEIRLYKDTWATIGNDNWRNIEATIMINAEGEGNQAVPEDEKPVRQHKYDLFNRALESYHAQIANYNPPEKNICPLLVWPEDYKAEVPYARDDCKSYIAKARTDFITGVMDINNDADWQKYLNQLDTLGFEQWLFYSQLVYEETVAAKG